MNQHLLKNLHDFRSSPIVIYLNTVTQCMAKVYVMRTAKPTGKYSELRRSSAGGISTLLAKQAHVCRIIALYPKKPKGACYDL